ncbi:hypothetical protein LMG29660_06745 [Burkholderia puraquae]|uniref:Uncharacterized protein n=1 Tax=Burkholderia puraquae TaxID=1904757 RepID=A0A6J5EXE3_9BURK|nr:hypothetical protein LMG29660_06745 [Burkholderia puraquae]
MISGLTLGFLTQRVGLMSVNHGWLEVPMSMQRNGVPDAFRFVIARLPAYLTMRNAGIDDTHAAHRRTGWVGPVSPLAI